MNDETRAALEEDTSADALDDIKKIQQEFGLTFSLGDPDRIVSAEQRTINDLFLALVEARHLLAEHNIDAMLNAVHRELMEVDR